jgi:hypothetical protein
VSDAEDKRVAGFALLLGFLELLSLVSGAAQLECYDMLTFITEKADAVKRSPRLIQYAFKKFAISNGVSICVSLNSSRTIHFKM